MATIPQRSLFSWKQIDAASDLDRLRLVLSVLPDEPLVATLEKHRRRGRDDYPIRPTWNALLAGIVFQHPSAAALLRELGEITILDLRWDSRSPDLPPTRNVRSQGLS